MRALDVYVSVEPRTKVGMTDSHCTVASSSRNGPGLATVEMFGMRFHNLTVSDVFAAIDDRIAVGEPGYIFTPNVDHVCTYQKSSAFREAYAGSFLVVADGMPVVWASRLLGCPLKEKISGSDLVTTLSGHCASKGHSATIRDIILRMAIIPYYM